MRLDRFQSSAHTRDIGAWPFPGAQAAELPVRRNVHYIAAADIQGTGRSYFHGPAFQRRSTSSLASANASELSVPHGCSPDNKTSFG